MNEEIMYSMNDNYKFLIETEWRDIHHSRVQEWSALGVIAALHIGLVQLLSLIRSIDEIDRAFPFLISTCFLIALLFCVLGILMTCRHRRLMWIKLNWIFEAEERLGLIKNSEHDSGIIPADYKMVKSNNYKEVLEKEFSESKKSETSIWNKLMWPRFLSTSWLIMAFYFLFGFIDFGFLIFTF